MSIEDPLNSEIAPAGSPFASSSLRQAYCRKLSQVQLAPCAHIAVVLSSSAKAACAAAFEHHAVLDISASEVIHYWPVAETARNTVQITPLQVFAQDFGIWRVVALPKSPEHGHEVLHRARSKIGEEEYNFVTNNCEHFATWAFDESGSSNQVRSMGLNVVSSAKAGILAGIAAASATTTVTTPWYLFGLIPWGTTTAIVPAVSTATAIGIGTAAFAGWVGLGLGMSYGLNKWAEHSNSQLSELVPIAVFNSSDTEIVIDVENIDSSSGLYPASVDDFVHDTRSYLGVGQRSLVLGSGLAGELNPPAEETLFHSFRLRVSTQKDSQLGLSFLATRQEIVTAEVLRGDVLVFTGSELQQVPDAVLEAKHE
eukprot:TRINITY_DN42535_c0_g1_i1.p1 TRINITY_DN42535_c0_g1~~TRINITY_DN42535_c0_g1_i1.p1  ORF type:complete len:369 (-),score=62.44 TRINITY_DN42535_c0_g1_i1:40-1146(-)